MQLAVEISDCIHKLVEKYLQINKERDGTEYEIRGKDVNKGAGRQDKRGSVMRSKGLDSGVKRSYKEQAALGVGDVWQDVNKSTMKQLQRTFERHSWRCVKGDKIGHNNHTR